MMNRITTIAHIVLFSISFLLLVVLALTEEMELKSVTGPSSDCLTSGMAGVKFGVCYYIAYLCIVIVLYCYNKKLEYLSSSIYILANELILRYQRFQNRF